MAEYQGCLDAWTKSSGSELAVSSLVAAVHWLSKIGDDDRKVEAERILQRAVDLKHAIDDRMAESVSGNTHKSCEEAQKSCTDGNVGATNNRKDTESAHQDTAEPRNDNQLSLESLAEFKSSKLWSFGSNCTLPQLPNQLKLQKVCFWHVFFASVATLHQKDGLWQHSGNHEQFSSMIR